MTVNELIEQLQVLSDYMRERPVKIEGTCCGGQCMATAESVVVVEDPENDWEELVLIKAEQ